MQPKRAAADLGHLKRSRTPSNIGKAMAAQHRTTLKESRPDGENCWEFYHQDGKSS